MKKLSFTFRSGKSKKGDRALKKRAAEKVPLSNEDESPKYFMDEDDDQSIRTSNSFSVKTTSFRKLFIKYFGSDTKFQLSWKEFFCFIMCLQVPLPYIMRHITIVKKWGATIVLGVYIASGLTISMPVYMVYMFLGNYSRRCYIKFWECVPLFKGLAYSIAISNVLIEVYNVALTGMSLLYINNLLKKEIPWLKCDYYNADPKCVPLLGKPVEHNDSCCDEFVDVNCTWLLQSQQSIKYSTIDFYNNGMLGLGYGKTPTYQGLMWGWILVVEIIWFMIFLSMAVGIRRIRGHLTNVNIIIGIVLVPLLIATLIVSPRNSTVADVETNFNDLFKYEFWLETSIHTLQIELPGDVITFSSLSKPGINTTMDTNIVYVIKLLFLTVLTVWLSNLLRMLQALYKIKQSLCLLVEGDILIFAIIPDLLSRWPVPRLWLLIHFLIVFFWGFLATVYVMISFLEALLEEYPFLVKWRMFVAGVICMIVGAGNVFVLRPNFMIQFRTFSETTYTILKVTLLMVSLWGLYLYPLQRFKNDYHFTYRTSLATYWVLGIKIATFLVSTAFILVWTIDVNKENNYWILGVTLAPIPIGMIVMSIRALKSRKTLVKPDPNWGPPSKQQKLARKRFDPTHELHCRSKIKCEHDCLTNSRELKKEINHWQSRRELTDEKKEK